MIQALYQPTCEDECERALVSVAVTTGLRTFLSKNERWLFFKMISVNIAIISGLGETWG